MTNDLDIAELELRLFPRPVDAWTPDDWWSFFVQAQTLVDQYGKESILAMVDDLVLAGAGATPAAADAIRHSIRP